MDTSDESLRGGGSLSGSTDPTTTLYTFMLTTDPSVNMVRLLGSWDNFARPYAMERDSRRDRGQWRGCHTFENIICDGDGDSCPQSQSLAPRSGGLKMGRTYYYYYEVDGLLETHDPALPSTTTCPYLPGQRVNCLWVPTERPSPVSSDSDFPCSDYRTMDPADRYLTPRPAIALPSAVRAPESSPLKSPSQLLPPRPESARPRSPAAAPSAWSPRRLFFRRTSPGHERSRPAIVTPAPATAQSKKPAPRSSSIDSHCEDRRPRIPRLATSASCSSFLSFSSSASPACRPRTSRPRTSQTPAAGPSSQGTRSREISPDSLRRFLVDEMPPPTGSSLLPSRPGSQDGNAVAGRLFLDDDDDDEHNFATSTTSETAPITILSPPPCQARGITPPRPHPIRVSTGMDPGALPRAPTRVPPAIPTPTAACAGPAQATDWLNPVQDTRPVFFPPSPKYSPRLSLSLERLPPVLPPSPMSFSAPFMPPASSKWPITASRATSVTNSHKDFSAPAAIVAAPLTIELPSPRLLPQRDAESKKTPTLHFRRRNRRHHLASAALAGSPTTVVVPGSESISAGRSSGLDDLIDKLGWMATAIHC
ncbi:hypothetical protein SEPCBS119000_003086 [Sporothrix epigloea]|uniref:Uncharacterized protein n=1 Tax=Sporothrix epigloea TaxID=1892477 RepID=A0ABP0DJR0_9PEZI